MMGTETSSETRGQAKPTALVLRTAGTNCDRETVVALERAGARALRRHVREVIEEPAHLERCALLVLPGGFSYGDDVAAGRVFGLELRAHLQDALARFVERGGFVLGICNGFQVLCETGLLEGTFARASQRSVALYENESGRFECRWVTVEEQPCRVPWMRGGTRIPMPVAHAEGRFTVRDAATLERLSAGGQIALRYVSETPGPVRYPDCPNGSVGAIAGVCDPSGRIVGLMPHPERNVSPFHHPYWTRLAHRSEGEGLDFYRRLVAHAADAQTTTTATT
jgi:phosphoribosylformylglycinamidine synthase